MLPHTVHPVSKTQVEVTLAHNRKKMVFNCGLEEYCDAAVKHISGLHIQDAFSFLTASEREFLMTGLTPEEWDNLFDDLS